MNHDLRHKDRYPFYYSKAKRRTSNGNIEFNVTTFDDDDHHDPEAHNTHSMFSNNNSTSINIPSSAYFSSSSSSSSSLPSPFGRSASSSSFLRNGNSLFRRFPRLSLFLLLLLALALLSFFLFLFASPSPPSSAFNGGSSSERTASGLSCRYPLQQAFHKYTAESGHYEIAIIADMDVASKASPNENSWRSIMKKGTLYRDPTSGAYSVSWNKEIEYSTKLNEGGRAFELSDLAFFDGKLYSFDDRTGAVFELLEEKAIPRHVLMEGNGRAGTKGMKIEWASVKDDLLYVGGTGKEWTTPEGEFVNNDPLWVKTIDRTGHIQYLDWTDVYQSMRIATTTTFPGYIWHEAARWNAAQRRWYFFPRRVSRLPYDDVLDEERGSNIVFSMNENFEDLQQTTIGELIVTHGFSSFQFIPWREDEVVALKTEEFKGSISTYIMVARLDGTILMDEQLVSGVKFEGIEII